MKRERGERKTEKERGERKNEKRQERERMK